MGLVGKVRVVVEMESVVQGGGQGGDGGVGGGGQGGGEVEGGCEVGV